MTAWILVVGLGVVAFPGAESGSSRPRAEQELLAALDRKIAKTNELRNEPNEEAPSPLGGLVKTSGLVLVMAVLAIGGSLLVKRGRERRWLQGEGSELSVKESVWVGRGQRLLLVSVGGRSVLLGATSQGFHNLGSFVPEDRTEMSPPVEAPDGGEAEFKNLLKAEMTKGPRETREQRRQIISRLQSL
ncbi:MAG: flagellar biosynthetic protein FliO [Myxococcota bacterium]